MNKPEEMSEHIFDLMSERTFDELTPIEKEDVLNSMTEEEYRENSMLIGVFQDVNSQLQFETDLPSNKQEENSEPIKGRFAFSYLQMAATVVVLISLGIGFGQFLKTEPTVLPIAVEEGVRDLEVSTPVYVNVSPVNPQASEVQLERIEQVAEQVSEEKGASLEEDDYPTELIISI